VDIFSGLSVICINTNCSNNW